MHVLMQRSIAKKLVNIYVNVRAGIGFVIVLANIMFDGVIR